ncbi:hypothetical protein WR25_21810 [Diploscapter pachys]|uniref:POLQ-like helical domain-containing protein n=1 Tax=Diploscapter pachys TaxID=2018661 RepID=A0A2A2L823_9BILA|nr:hypothetical protein WR25_21810 [Diploscapter pachys]
MIREAYLVISRAEMRDAMNIMRDYDCEPKIDSMNYARVFLEAIHTNLASNLELLQELWEQKFFASSVSHIDLVETLKNDWMIECEKTNLHPSQPETSFETGVYSCTSIGRATADAALRTDISLFILHDLDRANQLMVLANELHLVYLVTPSNAIFWESREEWANLESIYRQLNDDERKVAKLAHVKESFLHQRASGDKNGQKPKEEVVYEHNRFFCSLALYRLISEEPFDDVAKQFKLSRGELEILQQQSAQYATKILPFCREMEWHHLLILLKDLPFRIAFGVRNELNELVQIRGIDQKRARALFSDGFNSWAKILWASSDRISTALTQTFPMFNCSYKFEWLVGEEPLPLPEAALRIQQRARELLESRLREQGFDTSHLKHMLDNVKG